MNPLSVSIQPNGKILDLRHVNKCLMRKRIKYDDWKIALSTSYFEKGSFMFTFDLKERNVIFWCLLQYHEAKLGHNLKGDVMQCNAFCHQ